MRQCVLLTDVNSEIKDLIAMIDEEEKYHNSMRQCLQPNTNIDKKDKFGVSALMRSIRVNDPYGIQFLLKKKADANQRSKDGTTPLIEAARGDCSSGIMRLLLAADADVNAQNNVDGRTPLILSNSVLKAKLLLKNGAKVDKQDLRGFTALMHVVKKCFKYQGEAQLDLIRMFHKHGADSYIKNGQGKSVVDLIRGKNGSYFQNIIIVLGLPER